MATGILPAVISNVLESTPALSDRSSQLHRWGKEILERSTLGEVEQTAFDEFSEGLVSYVRERINAVCEGVTMDRSKRFKIWSDSHQARLDNSGPIHSAWIELLKKLSITGAEDDPLLEKSVNSELYGMLVAEYFSSPSAHAAIPMVSAPTQFTTDECATPAYHTW